MPFHCLENSANTTDIPMSGVSGQKPRSTKEGMTTVCKTDNFVPLVVPGLSTSSGSNSSTTSTSQDLSSTSPAQERSDELAPRRWCGSPSETRSKNKKRDGNQDLDNRLWDLLEWLEEFTDNPDNAELRALAHISQDSDSELPTTVVSKWRKHSIYTHFPKDRNCEVCLRIKNDTGSLQKTHWRRSTSSRKVWWLDNGWSQDPRWGGWITKQSPVRCRCSRSCYSMDSILSVQNKDFTGDGKEFTKVVKIYHGITEPQHLIDPRQMVLLKEP